MKRSSDPAPRRRSEKKPLGIALIPARAGSKRVPGKNVRCLAGHPVIAYTIAAAIDSGVFADVVVSTDSEAYADIARHYGAEVPVLRPAELAGDLSPDVDWVEQILKYLAKKGRRYDCFSILRPTSPFRRPETIRRAWNAFHGDSDLDSIRAVELCRQHPGKMWVLAGKRMVPLLEGKSGVTPWHSSQYQALPRVYVQNASLEIAWSRVVLEGRTIAGEIVAPFFTQDMEGFDLNQPADWRLAEEVAADNPKALPTVKQLPYVMEKQ